MLGPKKLLSGEDRGEEVVLTKLELISNVGNGAIPDNDSHEKLLRRGQAFLAKAPSYVIKSSSSVTYGLTYNI